MPAIYTDNPNIRCSDAHPRLHQQILSLSTTTVEADVGLLRPGKKFTIIQPDTEDDIKKGLRRGHFNLHFPIVFEDGVRWLLRVRRDYNRPEHLVCLPDHYWFGVEREVATLQAMAAAGLKTVPNAYLPPSKDSVTPGFDAAHFYSEFMPGGDMVLSDLPEAPVPRICMPTGLPMPPILVNNGPAIGVPVDLAEAGLFMGSYADHQIAISNIPFEGIGQLVRSKEGKFEAGPMGQQAIQLPGPPWMIGPCETLQEALFGYWDKQVDAARKRGQPPLRAYLSHLDKKRLLRSFGPLSQSTNTYINHADEGMFQYFRQDGRLSAVLDWEWAYTTIKEVAFSAPKAFLRGSDYQDSEELDSLTREEELLIEAYEARQRPDLADCVRSGPMYRLIGIDDQYSFRDIRAVTRFRRTFGRGEQGLTFPKTMNEWQAECLEMFKDDPGLAIYSAEDRLPEPERPPLVKTPAVLAYLAAMAARRAS